MWEPLNTPSFILPSLNLGNFVARYLKPAPVSSMALTQFFISLKFMCNGGNKMSINSSSGGC